jgi:hypothetical protein
MRRSSSKSVKDNSLLFSPPAGPLASAFTDRVTFRGERILKSIEWAWIQIACRRVISCMLIVALSLAVRLALLRVEPKPQPFAPDEFAYIFGGETFAKGRLATPTHPMWRFFETY